MAHGGALDGDPAEVGGGDGERCERERPGVEAGQEAGEGVLDGPAVEAEAIGEVGALADAAGIAGEDRPEEGVAAEDGCDGEQFARVRW